MYSADVTSASRIYAYELSRGVGGVGFLKTDTTDTTALMN